MDAGPAAQLFGIVGAVFVVGSLLERWRWGPALGAACVIALLLESLWRVFV